MVQRRLWLSVILAAAGAAGAPAESRAQASLSADRCRVETFAALPSDTASVRAAQIVDASCRIHASTKPTRESLINFEVWLPLAWNGKVVVTGNGGYSNALSYRDMAYALTEGYAAVGGDTGHQTPTPDDLQWGAGHPERILDWGTRSIHAITVPSQRIVAAITSAAPRRSYYYGCSTGGHQGYAEMQRYSQDFDGVIAGAPGNNRVRLNAAYLWQYLSNHSAADGNEILPASKLPLVTKAVVAACDKNDGVVDGVVDDPRACRFDAASLTCRGNDAPDCLTEPQVSVLNRMYAGVTNPRTGEQIYPGWSKSSEALTTLADGRPASGWNQYWGTREPMRVNFWRSWVFNDPQWNPRAFDFDRDLARADQSIGKLVDQRSTDLN